MENTCKNCGHVHTLNYCNKCGQVLITERFTTRKLIGDLFTKVFDLDRGLFYTFYSVLVRPHVVIRDYINGITKRYTNPAKLAIYLIAITTFLVVRNNNLDKNVQDINNALSMNNQHGLELQTAFVGFIKEYMQYFTLLFIPFFALSSKWLYRQFNYAEHLILQCYVYGVISILCLPCAIYIDKTSMATLIPFLITLAFYTFTFRKLFRQSVFTSAVKAALFYLIGYLLFMFLLVVGTFIYFLIKKMITGSAF